MHLKLSALHYTQKWKPVTNSLDVCTNITQMNESSRGSYFLCGLVSFYICCFYLFVYLCIFIFLMVASVEYQPKVSDSVKWMHVWCDKRYQTTEVNAAYFIHFVFTVVCVCVCLCVFWVIWVLFTRQGNPLSFRLSSWQPNDFSVVAVGIFDNRVVTLWRWWVWMCIWSFINWYSSVWQLCTYLGVECVFPVRAVWLRVI